MSLPCFDATARTLSRRRTSQAAPLVAGLAGLILSVDPALTPDQVQAIIQDTATDLGPAGWDADYG